MSTETAVDDQQAFHERIAVRNLAALWVARRGIDITRPASVARPALWRYDEIRPDIAEAGALVAAADAFRRVLVLENPAWPGEMRITNTLYAGLQLVLPGEVAPCHRHSQTAFRFVVEGEGSFTSVDGERTRMRPGDFIITPNWAWHDHVNQGEGSVVWLDGLDTPLVGFVDAAFRETYAEARYPTARPEGDAPARYGAGLMPMAPRPTGATASPVFNYPYERARAALEGVAHAGQWDACHGIKMRYINPATGGDATPTMAAFLQRLPAGFAGADYRSTDGAVYCVVEGAGRTVVGDDILDWRPRDVFVVPGWRDHRHESDGGAVLFSYSDRPVHQALGLWREERMDGDA